MSRRNREFAHVYGMSATDTANNAYATYHAEAELRDGSVRVHYSEYNGGDGRASIVLDRNRDGRPERILESNAQGGTSSCGWDCMRDLDAATARRVTEAVEQLVKTGHTELGTYRAIADFLEDPVHNSIPQVVDPDTRRR